MTLSIGEIVSYHFILPACRTDRFAMTGSFYRLILVKNHPKGIPYCIIIFLLWAENGSLFSVLSSLFSVDCSLFSAHRLPSLLADCLTPPVYFFTYLIISPVRWCFASLRWCFASLRWCFASLRWSFASLR
jgi:hypothetical protein